MDEFIQYHALACKYYPANSLNVFREACGAYDLRLFGTDMVLPLRSYGYVGSATSILYLPFFLLWKSVISGRAFGAILLAIEALILAKTRKLPYSAVFASLLVFFPYAFQHLVDTGPVGVQMLCIFLLSALAHKWATTRKIVYPILCGLIVFFAMWIKPIFGTVVPGLLLIFAWEFFSTQKKITFAYIRKMASGAVLGAALLCALGLVLLFSPHPDNAQYLPLLREIQGGSKAYSLMELIRVLPYINATKMLFTPLMATHRVFAPAEYPVFTAVHNILLFGVPAFVYLWCRVRKLCSGKLTLQTLIFACSFLLTFFFIARTEAAKAMHHIVLTLPFYILTLSSLAQMLREDVRIKKQKRTRTFLRFVAGIAAVLFVVVNLYWYSVFFLQKHMGDTLPSQGNVTRVLQNEKLAKKYMYIVLDWGVYYTQALYGPKDQAVLFMLPFNRDRYIDQLKQLSEESGRKLLFVHRESRHPDIERMKHGFNVSRCPDIDPSSPWQIQLEDPEDCTGTLPPVEMRVMANLLGM